jgi:hypothetical protein
MPWKSKKRILLTVKALIVRMSRQEPIKSARFATKMLPKRLLPICYQTDSGRGLTAGDQPFLPDDCAAEINSDPSLH